MKMNGHFMGKMSPQEKRKLVFCVKSTAEE